MICVMTLDKGWHFIFSFSLIGFFIAILAACCMVFNAPNMIANFMILVSPGLWLFLPRLLGGVGFTNGNVAVWFSFGLAAIANGMLYAMVGAVVAVLRWMLRHRIAAK